MDFPQTERARAYALARFDFRGKQDLWFWFISNRMISPIVLALPIYLLAMQLGLLDTHLGVILPTAAFNVPVTLFIMRAFFVTLPRELMDAARIDGCSEFGIFWRIAVPLARPAMFTAAIVNMIWVWNDFLFPLVFINTPAKKTLPVGLADFVGVIAVPGFDHDVELGPLGRHVQR